MTAADFLPSHVVPPRGLPTWAAPDGARPLPPLDPLLPVRVVDRRGDWAHALCSNGWSAWVDGRLLLPLPQGPPPPGAPPARTADPRPLLDAAAEALDTYRVLAAELAAGRLDAGTFAERTRGLRLGVVVDGGSLWAYDVRHERWCYCDGASLSVFAVEHGPRGDGGDGGGGRDARDGGDEGDPGDPGGSWDSGGGRW